MSIIYEPKGRAREYSPLALNFYKGCIHGCNYCYVPRIFKRFNKEYNHSNCYSTIDYGILESYAKKYQGCGKQILLSFTGDPYCESDTDTTRNVLEILNQYTHKVAILTKGGFKCLRDIDTFKRFGDRIKVGATLTFSNNEDSLKWEGGAALPNERIMALEMLKDEGIKTWASFEPVIIPAQSLELLKMVVNIVDHVKIGKLNDYEGLDKEIDWGNFLDRAVKICRENNLKFYIKKDLQLHNRGTHLNEDEMNEDYLNL